MSTGIQQTPPLSPALPVFLQCPVCGRRYEYGKLPPGKQARCTCQFHFVIPAAEGWVRLPRLDLKPSRLGVTAIGPVTLTPVPPPAKVPVLLPGPAAPATATTFGAEEDHPILKAVRAGQALPLRLFLLRRRAEELALISGYDQLTCLPLLKGVDSYDYQERTASHVLRELAGRALLADEVGLGKTIEAGIILKELYARGLVRKVLILTPASLVTQWRDELAAKFHLKFEVAKEPGDWAALARVVCSIDTAKSAQNMAEIQGIHWDMVIVDEAHKLRDNKTLNWKLVNGIGKRYILMLSATPFQNDLMELFNMITILRPGQLYTEREFRRKFLRRGNPREARDPEALRQLLRQVMVRNRRGEVDVRFTQRIPETRHLEMFEPERRLYESAVRFCRERFGDLYGGAAGLVAIGYLKQLCSSSFSFRESLVGNVLPRAQATKDSQIVREAESLLRLADDVRENVKLEALVELLKSHQDRVLVFTQYRGTQDFVAARLRIEGIPHTVFNGSLSSDEKDRAIGQFRGEARVLVSTESGGEGRNLQFAFRMVNYDLPWNPMRVEQRIGRIHRMGQTCDVFVTSLACKDTVEDYILRLLEHKLNLFRLVVGEVDGILGKLRMDEHIAKLFLVSRDDVDFQRRMEEFGDELVALRTRYERCKQDNEQLLCKLSIEGAA